MERVTRNDNERPANGKRKETVGSDIAEETRNRSIWGAEDGPTGPLVSRSTSAIA